MNDISNDIYIALMEVVKLVAPALANDPAVQAAVRTQAYALDIAIDSAITEARDAHERIEHTKD